MGKYTAWVLITAVLGATTVAVSAAAAGVDSAIMTSCVGVSAAVVGVVGTIVVKGKGGK